MSFTEFDATGIELERISCDLCGGNETTLEFEAKDIRYGLPGSFNVVRCRKCHLVFTNPRPLKRASNAYYPDDYRPHIGGKREYENWFGAVYRRMAFSRKANLFSRMLGDVYNHLAYRQFVSKEVDPALVLDVGCGTGDYLGVWRELGWNVQGLEMDDSAAGIAKKKLGFCVGVGRLAEATLPAAGFDLVAMSHVLEHMHSPSLALRKIAHVLKPGGRILITVPNYASWDRHVFGPRWQGLEVPRHLYHFEPQSLSVMLESEGFAIEQMGSSAHPGSLIRSIRGLCKKGRPSGRISSVERCLGWFVQLVPALLMCGTSLWVVARLRSGREPLGENGKSAGKTT